MIAKVLDPVKQIPSVGTQALAPGMAPEPVALQYFQNILKHHAERVSRPVL